MVEMSKNSSKAYRTFARLRKDLPGVDVYTLRHLSVYIAKTNEEFDANNDLRIIFSKDNKEIKIILIDGSVIKLVNNLIDPLYFVVEKSDKDIDMMLSVSKLEPYNLNTAYVCGKVSVGDWMYQVGADEFHDNICYIKVYYKDELIDCGTSYFDVSVDDEIGLDCIDGLGHLTSVMMVIEQLYNNVKCVSCSTLVRRK